MLTNDVIECLFNLLISLNTNIEILNRKLESLDTELTYLNDQELGRK